MAMQMRHWYESIIDRCAVYGWASQFAKTMLTGVSIGLVLALAGFAVNQLGHDPVSIQTALPYAALAILAASLIAYGKCTAPCELQIDEDGVRFRGSGRRDQDLAFSQIEKVVIGPRCRGRYIAVFHLEEPFTQMKFVIRDRSTSGDEIESFKAALAAHEVKIGESEEEEKL